MHLKFRGEYWNQILNSGDNSWTLIQSYTCVDPGKEIKSFGSDWETDDCEMLEITCHFSVRQGGCI